jgi:hypothetical protein
MSSACPKLKVRISVLAPARIFFFHSSSLILWKERVVAAPVGVRDWSCKQPYGIILFSIYEQLLYRKRQLYL